MSQLNIRKTDLDGVLVIEPPTRFEDFRGNYIETYNEEIYRAAGIDCDFVQDDISCSNRHVLRGLHGDSKTWKLVSCLVGKFYLVVVNWDPESPQYGKSMSITLSDTNNLQVLIPPKHGNGHLVMSEWAMFHYKQTSYYDREGQFTLHWDDPKLGLWWPIDNPIVSQRDERPR